MSRSSAPSLSLLITALLATGATSGCGSLALGKGTFSCAGHPSHPMCLPTSKVYALTESSAPLQAVDEAPEPDAHIGFRAETETVAEAEPTALELFTGAATPEPRPRFKRKTSAPEPDLQPPPRLPDGLEPFPGIADEDLLLPRSTDPLPLRLPAQVMRLWLAPWEDDRGDLHASGYVFTEIAPRTWTLAEGPSRFSNAVLRPLQVAERRAQPGEQATRRSAPSAGLTDRIPNATPTPRSQP
ncbi:TraV family lipoprotein [Thiorhodococcus minor]|uniref:TraV family lipoprotein n=1 Tax=Thiorhodococcus minor TaxID=57489 RepID=A0A6M0JVX4_9GAMM|nr:TraV family lipoprotein [Thiorhodococcus minor]NEV60335.1 TraV family lipoprotein [Thiorhodococcus minor]